MLLKHHNLMKNSFYKAIDFLKKMNNNENLSNHQLLEDYERPFIYLFKTCSKNKMKMSIDTQQEFKMQ